MLRVSLVGPALLACTDLKKLTQLKCRLGEYSRYPIHLKSFFGTRNLSEFVRFKFVARLDAESLKKKKVNVLSAKHDTFCTLGEENALAKNSK